MGLTKQEMDALLKHANDYLGSGAYPRGVAKELAEALPVLVADLLETRCRLELSAAACHFIADYHYIKAEAMEGDSRDDEEIAEEAGRCNGARECLGAVQALRQDGFIKCVAGRHPCTRPATQALWGGLDGPVCDECLAELQNKPDSVTPIPKHFRKPV